MMIYHPSKKFHRLEVVMIDLYSRTNMKDKMEPQGETKEWRVGRLDGQVTRLWIDLDNEQKQAWIVVLKDKKYLFSWTLVDLLSIHLGVILNELTVLREAKLIAHKKWCLVKNIDWQHKLR